LPDLVSEIGVFKNMRRFTGWLCPALFLILAMGVGSAGGAGRTLPQTLIKNGEVCATIVIPDADPKTAGKGDHQTALKAAGILNRYLVRSSGAELPIVEASKAPATGALVLLGRSVLSEKFGLTPPVASEAVRIVSFPRGLAILGETAPPGTNNEASVRDRGTVHGVYLFLETLGFRFYFNEGPDAELGEVVPNLPTVEVGPIDEVIKPAFPYRQTHDRARGILLEGSATGFQCNHTHEGWDAFYKENHPEYFSLRADGTRDFGSLCYSNPEVLKQELKHIEDYYRTGRWVGSRPPTGKYIQVEPADNWNECQCENCQALVQPEKGRFGRNSRLWWDHYIYRLAEEVARRWPDKRIAALAYQGRLFPGEKKLPDNVDVMVCIHNGQISFQKEPKAKEAVDALVSRWSENLGRNRERMFVWDYQCYPAFWTTAPIIFPHLLQKFLQDHRDKMSGVFINRSIDHNHQYTHFMEALAMRLLWQPDLDVEACLRDYCEKFYGPGAEAMEKVYKLLIDRYEQTAWPGYDQARDTAWVSPKMLFGRTYTPGVIEKIEQELLNAQEAVGWMPGGRVRSFDQGEGWFIRRNGSGTEEAFRVTFEATDQSVKEPVLRWEGGSLRYEGTLHRGQKLVVDPGPRAILYSLVPEAPAELIPEEKKLPGEGQTFDDGYLVHMVNHLGIPAFPGAKFAISVSGFAEGGANSYAEITWRGAASTFVLDSRFSNQSGTITETFEAPPGAQTLESVRLFRRYDVGRVAYANLSLRRDFDEIQQPLPEPEDVSNRITGDVPMIPAETTYLFHVFSLNSSVGVQRQKVDAHLDQGKRAVSDESSEDSLATGGASLRIRLSPESQKTLSDGEPGIYQKRVAWMREAFEDFHPQTTMYTTHDGFLPSAHIVHRWLKRLPKYRVQRAEAVPDSTTEDEAWKKTVPLELVRGRARAKVPLDNLGFDAGNGKTKVRFLHDDNHLYVWFQCEQPEPANDADEVTLTFHSQTGTNSLTCKPRSGLKSGMSGAMGKVGAEHGQWNAWVTIPKRAVLGDSEKEVSMEITRTRQGGVTYVWSPPLNAPWEDLPPSRRGRLQFD
jgi:hypothetical protein